ncbi:plasma membrane protein Pth11-like protein [Xylaria arbuscula]|nr:plasma membrane protein Pth11-like protein [Xylaria arbuscula]
MSAKQEYFETPGHVIAASIVVPLLDLLALAIRFHIRRKLKHGLKADDWLILLATVLTIGMGITLIYGVAHKSIAYRFKVPQNLEDDPFAAATPQAALTGKIELAVLLMLPLVLGFIKASFLTFYMRIFSVNNRDWRHNLLLGMICFIALWATAFFFAQLFGCRLNFYAYWRSTNDFLTKCVHTEQLFLTLSITDFITDVVLIIIPLPLIWQLNMSRRKKIAMLLIFSLGAVTIAASLTRLIFTAKIVQRGFNPKDDPIFVITNGLYWGVVECSVGILAADLPTLQSVTRLPAWKSLKSTSKSLWDITSLKSKLLKSKASQMSSRRDPDTSQADLRTSKNDSISFHSAGRQGKVSEEEFLGIEMSNLNGTHESVSVLIKQ